MKKKLFNIILSLLTIVTLVTTLSTNVFANSNISSPEKNNIVTTITVSDENGNDKIVPIYNNTVNNIPLYSYKEGDSSRSLQTVATLSIYYGNGKLLFVFTPANIGISLITVGFVGDFTSYNTGIRWGYNNYILPVMSGSISASPHGIGVLSGTYTVFGYAPIKISRGVSW